MSMKIRSNLADLKARGILRYNLIHTFDTHTHLAL